MHGLLVKTIGGDTRRNSLVKIAADMIRLAGEFGLTPVANETGTLLIGG
jgi:phage terminase small subunit